LFGAPLTTGTYNGGAVRVPMNRITPPTPVGMPRSPAPTTGPEFDVFLVARALPKP
jgi:hypothetical protein